MTAIWQPQGRLTLLSGVAITSADIIGAATVYCTPAGGQHFPAWDGVTFSMVDMGGELALHLDATPAHDGYHQAGRNFDLWNAVSGSVVLGTGAAWTDEQDREPREIIAGIRVNQNQIDLRVGDGANDLVTIPARQATYSGTMRMVANGQVSDTARQRLLWNAHAKAPRSLRRFDPDANWTQITAAYRQANNNAQNQVEVVRGEDEDAVFLELVASATNSTATPRIAAVAIGLDSVAVKAPESVSHLGTCTSACSFVGTAVYCGLPGSGFHRFVWLERGHGVETQRWWGDGVANAQSGLIGVAAA